MRVLPLLVLAALLAGCNASVDGVGPPATRGSAFGTVVAAAQEGELWNVTLDAVAVDCERNATRWTGRVRVAEPLAPGQEVGVRAEDGLNLAGEWRNLTAYAAACAPQHEADVRLVGLEPPKGAPPEGTAVRLRGVPVPLGEPTLVGARVETAQDQPVEVRFSGLVVKESSFGPGGRAQCEVKPADLNVTLAARGGRVLDLLVDCPADAPVNATRLSAVWGRYDFVDELGFAHHREGVLWQFLQPGRPASLRVDAPAEARSGDDLVVRARYEDAQGQPIRGAQVSVWLQWPDQRLPRQGMREEADGTYVFRFADLQEWAPRDWPAGERLVVVEADDPQGGHVWQAAQAKVRYA
ncbi:MAG TPA: hypothetical protein VNX21_07785 [Candidatus Thermoplasmatota archaeon]|nr:hypothetical protein [Candidatus Thermoplasmatota archaeon]